MSSRYIKTIISEIRIAQMLHASDGTCKDQRLATVAQATNQGREQPPVHHSPCTTNIAKRLVVATAGSKDKRRTVKAQEPHRLSLSSPEGRYALRDPGPRGHFPKFSCTVLLYQSNGSRKL